MEVLLTQNEQQTQQAGAQLAARLAIPSVVLLSGTLGAGKTVFTRGLVLGLGGDAVRSPSFSLVNLYETPAGQVYHVDLYRLNSTKELHSIGLEEILASNSIVIIEWAEKLAIPIPGSISVRILVDPATAARRIEIDES